MLEIIDAGGVDLNLDGLIEKRSLLEFQEACALALHWNDRGSRPFGLRNLLRVAIGSYCPTLQGGAFLLLM